MRGDHSDAARLPEAKTVRWQIPLAVICAFALANLVAAEPPAIKVEWRASLLSVTAKKADIVPVLETVQAETGLEIQGLERLRGLPEPKRTISVTFENLPLPDGLHRLLSGFSYGVVEFYTPKPGTLGVSLYVASQQGTPHRREDEHKGSISAAADHAQTDAK